MSADTRNEPPDAAVGVPAVVALAVGFADRATAGVEDWGAGGVADAVTAGGWLADEEHALSSKPNAMAATSQSPRPDRAGVSTNGIVQGNEAETRSHTHNNARAARAGRAAKCAIDPP
jgi:hypothetical protein